MKCRFEWYLNDEVVAWLKAEAERRNRENPLPECAAPWDWKKVAMASMSVAIAHEMEEQQAAAVS